MFLSALHHSKPGSTRCSEAEAFVTKFSSIISTPLVSLAKVLRYDRRMQAKSRPSEARTNPPGLRRPTKQRVASALHKGHMFALFHPAG